MECGKTVSGYDDRLKNKIVTMKRRKPVLKSTGKNDVYNNGSVRVTKEEDIYFFEIGNELTSDIAEAVALLMRKLDFNDSIWDMELDKIDTESITPEKSLFWLTGGYTEWRTLENYNKPWCDCYLDFQEEFGMLIFNIIKRNKKLREIRDNYYKYLNLSILYDFALSKNMIK
jgi:hypothetical protein